MSHLSLTLSLKGPQKFLENSLSKKGILEFRFMRLFFLFKCISQMKIQFFIRILFYENRENKFSRKMKKNCDLYSSTKFG